MKIADKCEKTHARQNPNVRLKRRQKLLFVTDNPSGTLRAPPSLTQGRQLPPQSLR